MKKAQFTKPLTIALRPEAFEQVKQVTDYQQISMAEWVRDAVDAALKTNQQEEDDLNEQ